MALGWKIWRTDDYWYWKSCAAESAQNLEFLVGQQDLGLWWELLLMAVCEWYDSNQY